MLVLSRRCRETIVLPGDGVTIRVLEIRSNRVRLGIEAPSGVSVLRGELLCDLETSDDKPAAHRGPRNESATPEKTGTRPRRGSCARLVAPG
jgi:carbon storage regulator